MSLFNKTIQASLAFSLLVNVASADIEAVLGPVSLNQNANLPTPGFAPSSKSPEILISRKQYVISYNKKRRSPNWAAWKVANDRLGDAPRVNAFARDLELEQYLQKTNPKYHAVEPSEYTGSCFDRGHVVPSADRTDSPENNKETFVMSNMLPQTAHMNRVVWKHLEMYTRDLVQNEKKKVYVISGPIYDRHVGAIGPERDIPVPSKEFKIMVIREADKRSRILAVVIPNTDSDGRLPSTEPQQNCSTASDRPEDQNDWEQYKTTVAEVERLSGLKIFSDLRQSLAKSAAFTESVQ